MTLCYKANAWYDCLNIEIERINSVALRNSSQIPEVIAWYNKLCTDVTNRTKVLETEVSVEFTYADPFRKGAEKKSNMTFSVSTNL